VNGTCTPTSAHSTVHRLVELLTVLEVRSRPVSLGELRDVVPGYRARVAEGLAAGRPREEVIDDVRDLQRSDAEHLRRAGVDVRVSGEQGTDASLQVRSGGLSMAPFNLAPMEVLALFLALRTWSAPLPAAVVRSGGVLASAGTSSAVPFLGLAEAAAGTPGVAPSSLAAVARAVDERVPVTFAYARPGEEALQRRVDPWGLVRCWGRLYLVGFDRERQDARAFRASRIQGDVVTVAGADPAGFTPAPPGADLASYLFAVLPERSAVVRVAPEEEARLRHELGDDARPVEESAKEPAGGLGSGWPELRVRFWDAEWIAGILRQYGDAVEVREPDDVRALVRSGLAAVADVVAAIRAGADT